MTMPFFQACRGHEFGAWASRGSGPRRAARILMAPALFLLTTASPPLAQAQGWTTTQVSRQIQGEESARVTVRYPSGRISLTGVDSPLLFSMRLRYDADAFRPLQRYEAGHVTVGVEGTGRGAGLLRGPSQAELELALSSRTPIDLNLELGAVEAGLDLGGLRLRTLSLNTGASNGEVRVSSPNPDPMAWARIRVGAASFRGTQLGHLNAGEIEVDAGVGDVVLDLSGLQRQETLVRVRMGIGSLEIRVPDEAGVRLIRRSFLVSLTAPGLQGEGDELYSSNWEDAPTRIELEVHAALGSVSVLPAAR